MRAFLLLCLMSCPVGAEVVVVKNTAELRAALGKLAKGDILKIGPGEYAADLHVAGIGDLTVEALDATAPPHFKGGKQAWHFSRCEGLKLRHVKCSGQSANGINLDDGGKREDPVKGILLEGVEVSDIGPKGNFDAIKCSGLQGLRIKDCTISGWGGQAIDLVGCSESVIEGCTITGKEGYSQHTGPQFKGGCRDITIRNCVLKNAGERPIQAGGSTGLDYFRPPGVKYEAKDIIIRDNTIEGGMCATAFTGVDGAEFTGNKIVNPEKWVFRVLQETKEEGFAPCRNVKIAGNEIRFLREKVGAEVNVGGGTAVETFRFEGNTWVATDRPERSKPKLPVEEVAGKYGE
ncbi:right-handed parallel beta-helix repeat-containing protein [Luteolibacter sp. GHJ8]|uniref:Right-handed parallel beta-helix repeat-containing protein n=1 Tax=Luteolibacter rhizosphaerae TaxID=2989719 RepID=A0ABT3GBL5_9BACT|nr:right-handed parallel beta-helix repeat-containing protein [Luteolibacter rhizosphaerae]MCW1917019.1 right-handed parallel beta-helix repeat-containing protein [Luteolibacter rhizosphaerae]